MKRLMKKSRKEVDEQHREVESAKKVDSRSPEFKRLVSYALLGSQFKKNMK